MLSDPTKVNFAADGWETVTLPHTWNQIGSYSIEPARQKHDFQGVGWYRLKLDESLPAAGKRYFLDFGAVGAIADVWVNAVHVGSHAGAFSRFRVDITEALRANDGNVIVVRADNSKPARGSSTEHVIPLMGDFFVHGGLYRDVALISVPAAHIELLDFGGPGVYASTAEIDRGGALIDVLTRMRNDDNVPRSLVLEVKILDDAGRTAAERQSSVELTATSTGEHSMQLHLADPHLWNGRRDPYLYKLAVTLRDEERTLDQIEQPLGVRSFRIDPEQGFFLNGSPLQLHGVSRHQDWLDRGWAVTHADHVHDMALIAELGANTVRLAHYQHADDWFDAADRTGMIAWAEVPFVNKVAFGNAPASPALIANARQQLIELIRQNYNHPSVVTWGVGNEVDIDMAFGRLGPKADARPLVRELHELARAEDPSRPTALADCCEDTPVNTIEGLPSLAGITDLMGYNRYFGWYYGGLGDLGPHLDALHAKHPQVPLSVSEYGAGGALSQHTDNPAGGRINTSGRPHPEEFQSWFHERSWPQLQRRRYLWASWIWNMFDFSSDIRREGDATDINDKGLVSFDRRVKKDAFYFYKAHWSSEPVLYITGRRYVERRYPVTDVRVYSNAATVSLTLNGRELGSVPCEERICVFKDVALDAGTNELGATAQFGERRLHDTVNWNAPPAAAGLAINVGDLSGFVTSSGRRVGSDNWFTGGIAGQLAPATAARVKNGGDRQVFSGYREGRFSYAIPLPEGSWRVTLTLLEPLKRTPRRRFDVIANGKIVLESFEPVKAAGGALRAVARSFNVSTPQKKLTLDFVPRDGKAVLAAIDIAPVR